MYCTKVFGIYPEGSGKPEKIIKQGSDTIRFFFDKNNSGSSVEDEIQGVRLEAGRLVQLARGGDNEDSSRGNRKEGPEGGFTK